MTNLLARGALVPSNNQTDGRLALNVSVAPSDWGPINESTYQTELPWPPNENARIVMAVIVAVIISTHGVCFFWVRPERIRITCYYVSIALVAGIAVYGAWLPPRTVAASFLRF